MFEGTVSADCSRYVKIIDLYYCTLRRWEVHGMREDDGEDEEPVPIVAPQKRR